MGFSRLGLPVGVVSAIESGVPRIEPYVELSQVGYLLVVDYGLSRSLPQPVQVVAKPSKRKPPGEDDTIR